MYKILIVEDDKTISRVLKEHLEKWGYEVETVKDFQKVLEEFVAFDPQIVLLDIGLPFFNGHHWCSEIRAISKVPIIFISSADDNMNIVMALNMGGDDFIAKPFDMNVITAKVQALLRRTYSFKEQTNLIEHKGAVLNLSDATLTYQDQKIELTKNEYRILHTLMASIGKIVSRDDIITALWEDDSFVDDNTLTVNVTRLRRKLAEAGLSEFIKTKKGIGYVVEA
ncbi:response regulator transcription factor [Anaerovorax odorimutans]|uniref:Stage 0 sporulation protein A homolog n=1 Tax=Anaerovorax odorimutans TaxID=109327 RepID=A0ABT1RR43_9FIRM|nr:response regulator transcription factor [Anaerovorax odorimutans]MCQ4637647.1 response regulator transcription factor [Anaerovorax odorimutans]